MLLFGTAAAAALIAPTNAGAAGFYLQEQSVRGWGRANSGEVADQGPASLWWNPAAIAGSKNPSATFNATAIVPRGRVEDKGTLIDRPAVPPAPVGGSLSLKDPILRGVAPGSAFALPVSNRIALGLAVTAPFSFTTDYDPNGWQRYSAIRSRLVTLDIQPSLAVVASDWLSLGAGLNVEYADAWLSNALPNLAPGSADGRLRLTGSGWDLGWSLGAQLKPAAGVTVAAAYKSAVHHKLDGSVDISGLAGPLAARNGKADTTASFTTPWQLVIGARAAVSDGLTLNAQAVRYGWSRFDQIDLAAPLNTAIEENYRNTWSVAVGADRRFGDRLTLRAGVQLDPTPTRDSSRDARVPDGDRIDYNVGATFSLGERLSIDAAAGYTDVQNSRITRDERFYAGTAAQSEVLTEGRAYAQSVLVFSLGARLDF
jgi:long-chain fatty acid transport protein